MEYEYATAKNIPVAAFLLHEDSRRGWPRDKVEFEKLEKINKFRKLCEGKLVLYWKSADDLGSKIVTSLIQLMRDKPRTGFVRGNVVASQDALNEIASLSREKRELLEKLQMYEIEKKKPASPRGDAFFDRKAQGYVGK